MGPTQHFTSDDSEEQLKEALRQAIINEYSIGPERLPASRKVYFRHDLQRLLEAPITYQKSWFCTVQLAQKYANIVITSPFITTGTPRLWVGLQDPPMHPTQYKYADAIMIFYLQDTSYVVMNLMSPAIRGI